MDSTQRKGINFDLDTESLKEHYFMFDYSVFVYYSLSGFFHFGNNHSL